MYHTISPGMTIEDRKIVTVEDSAAHIGSGSLKVFATPAMVAFVERICRALVEPMLPESKTTVGSSIKIKHLAPTPLGAEVHIRAIVEIVDENVIKFSAQVWDGIEKVGEAEHTRVVIEIDRFLKRVEQKSTTEPN